MQRELSSPVEAATHLFNSFLSKRRASHESSHIAKINATDGDVQEMVKAWIGRITDAKAETLVGSLHGSLLPVYVVDCPKLHVIPKKFLKYRLRWCDKYAYEVFSDSSSYNNSLIMRRAYRKTHQ
jgi:hypothetical protein